MCDHFIKKESIIMQTVGYSWLAGCNEQQLTAWHQDESKFEKLVGSTLYAQ